MHSYYNSSSLNQQSQHMASDHSNNAGRFKLLFLSVMVEKRFVQNDYLLPDCTRTNVI